MIVDTNYVASQGELILVKFPVPKEEMRIIAGSGNVHFSML